MKEENFKRLINFLSKYIESGEPQYDPQDIQYSYYINIFLDENKNGNRLHIDKFSQELARRLIAERGIRELDSNDANYNCESEQQKRYDSFYLTWYSWNILYDKLQESGRFDTIS
ncbi:hypothetical protein [Legionella drancourtii]|uniref:hypothetical protein n=1 Tax=Legionella drancourtii TaxID=168933 RepID=UPI00058E7987|nr:hypothetical protein [Legionella drancourtii]